MPTQTIDTTEEADTGNEFLVHTKHTCDACFIRPIVGKRYTSATHPDFDLCSKCFCSYDEDKRGEFAETLLGKIEFMLMFSCDALFRHCSDHHLLCWLFVAQLVIKLRRTVFSSSLRLLLGANKVRHQKSVFNILAEKLQCPLT